MDSSIKERGVGEPVCSLSLCRPQPGSPIPYTLFLTETGTKRTLFINLEN